jgi:hypothetical protein
MTSAPVRVPWWFSCISFLTFTLMILSWIVVSGESFKAPPGSMGDDVYFENIAFHLAKNEGVKLDFQNEEWRQPFRDANRDKQYEWVLALRHKGITTSRSPGFPFMVAAIYRVAGRNFLIVRLVNAVILAAALSCLLSVIYRWHGPVVAILALVTLSLDYFVLVTAGQIMSEALGIAISSVMFAICIWISHAPRMSDRSQTFAWLGVGLIFGVASLVRANLNAWLLIIVACLIAGLLFQCFRRCACRPLLKYGLSFCLGVGLIASPWWIRNCVVTESFAPFGTSGSFGLVGGYCDAAYADWGNWNLPASVASLRQTTKRPGFFQLKLAQQEQLSGQDSVGLAKHWILNHWEKMPSLMGMKIVNHLGFYNQPVPILWLNGILVVGAMIGCYATRRGTGAWIAIFLLLSIFSTSLTWPHYGRYSLPVRPLMHVASAIGAVYFWSWVLRKGGNHDWGISEEPTQLS